MTTSKHNDEERQQWIDNDEGLYNWFRAWRRENHGGSMRQFIKAHRTEIDAVIDNIQSGRKPASYLVYGG